MMPIAQTTRSSFGARGTVDRTSNVQKYIIVLDTFPNHLIHASAVPALAVAFSHLRHPLSHSARARAPTASKYLVPVIFLGIFNIHSKNSNSESNAMQLHLLKTNTSLPFPGNA